jgi:hypothetical protein
VPIPAATRSDAAADGVCVWICDECACRNISTSSVCANARCGAARRCPNGHPTLHAHAQVLCVRVCVCGVSSGRVCVCVGGGGGSCPALLTGPAVCSAVLHAQHADAPCVRTATCAAPHTDAPCKRAHLPAANA